VLIVEGPSGGTPLIRSLNTVISEKAATSRAIDRQLLIVVITDGVPSDGTHEDVSAVLRSKPANVHVSFAECTDQPEDMEWLDELDASIANFDNTDDYREDLAKVRRARGPNFKYDFNDYVIKILLATWVSDYFNVDRAGGAGGGCCVIL